MTDTQKHDLNPPHANTRIGPKVLLLITKGVNGGAQTHILALCQSLIGQVQFSVAIGGPKQSSVLSEGLALLGVPVVWVPPLGNSLSPLKFFSAVRVLLKLIRLHRPDLVHAHSTAAGAVARVAGAFEQVPIIYTVHGFGFKPEVPLLQRSMVWLVEFALAPFTSHMICVSSFERRMARSLPLLGCRMSTIANALPDSPERANPADGSVSAVMVARFDAPKRQDLLIHALANLRDEYGHELPTSFVGDGPDRIFCQALVKKLELRSVVFVGDVNDVPKRLSQHDIFVLASDHEGMPISIIEAMRAGLPILASDLPGIRELINPEESGLLVLNQTEELAKALRRLANSPNLRQSMGQAARLRYVECFTPDHSASLVLQLYLKFSEPRLALSA